MSDGSNTPPPVGPQPGRAARPRPTGSTPVPPAAVRPPVAPVPPFTQVPPVAPVGTVYDETIVARSQIGVSVAIAVILAVVLLAIRVSLWPFAIIVLLAVGGVGVYLAGLSVAVTRTYVEIGQGRRESNPRRISSYEIVEASTAELTTWSQVFGFGLPRPAGTTSVTRLTVRPGPTLVLELTSGEVVRVSTPDPARAIAALGSAAR